MTVDLPGTYYLQVVEQLFKENRLAGGSFDYLGPPNRLTGMRCPLFLLAARDDDVVASEQIFATAHLVGPRYCAIEKATAPCGISACSWAGRSWSRSGPKSRAGCCTEAFQPAVGKSEPASTSRPTVGAPPNL
jgi:hypothetical protein